MLRVEVGPLGKLSELGDGVMVHVLADGGQHDLERSINEFDLIRGSEHSCSLGFRSLHLFDRILASTSLSLFLLGFSSPRFGGAFPVNHPSFLPVSDPILTATKAGEGSEVLLSGGGAL